jgi:hypothetical protein
MSLNWICSDCGAFNPPKRNCCWQCATEHVLLEKESAVLAQLHKWRLLDKLPASTMSMQESAHIRMLSPARLFEWRMARLNGLSGKRKEALAGLWAG